MNKYIPAALATCLLACSGAITDNSPDDPAVLQFHGSEDTRSSTSGGNLIDHGGKVLPNSNTYAIFWGAQTSFPADAQEGLDAMFNGLAGTSYLNISSQYMRGNVSTSSFHTNWNDLSSPPSHSPSVSTIVNEACKVIGQNNVAPDTSGLYLVYTSNFPRGFNACAWHSYGQCNGITIQVAYMPNLTNVNGCNPGDLYGCNTYSEGTRAWQNASSHEFFETITDSTISAWYDSSGSEIGDKCNFTFKSCVNLTTGNFQLQQEWSNTNSSCVQQ